MPQLPMAGPATFGRRASGADFGGAEADAAAQRGGALGGVGQAATQTVVRFDQVQEAANDAKLARKAAEVSAGYDKAVFDLSADPDIDTHEERFEKTRAQVLKDAQATLPPELHGRLEDRVFGAGAHARIEVAGNVRTKRIGAARADTDEMLRLSADQAAQTPDPVRRGQIRGQAVGALDAQLHGGILDQAAYDKAVRGFDRDVSMADFRRITRENPVEALRRLQNPKDPISAGFDEAERQQMIGQAVTEHEQQLAQGRAQRQFDLAQADRAEREAADAIQRDADDALAKGDMGALQAQLARGRDVLTPEQRRWYLERIAKGTGMAGDATRKSDPGVYMELAARAAAGEVVNDEAGAAYRRGDIDQDDFERIRKRSEDRRFGEVEKFLTGSTAQGMFDFDPARRAKAAEIQRQFMAWSSANPKASSADALELGRKLLRDQGFKDLSTLPQPQSSPPAAAGQFDANAATAAAIARHDRGEVEDAALDDELKRIDALEEAQRLAGSTK